MWIKDLRFSDENVRQPRKGHGRYFLNHILRDQIKHFTQILTKHGSRKYPIPPSAKH